jgi:ribose transport system permease protein
MPADFVSQVVLVFIPLLVMAAGQAVVMTGGGIDLAAPAAALAALTVGSWVFGVTSGSVVAAAVAMPVAGLVLGMLQGLGVARLPLPAWTVSLGVLGVLGGLTAAPMAVGVPESVARAMAALAGPLAAWVGLALLVGVTIHLAMETTVGGPWLRAVGCHRESARAAGVPVAAVTVGAYALSGLTAGLAAVFLVVHPERLSSDGGRLLPGWWLVDVLAAVVVGGAHRPGGRGLMGRVLVGALVVVLLGSLLALTGAPPGVIAAVKSMVVLAVLAFRVRGDGCS